MVQAQWGQSAVEHDRALSLTPPWPLAILHLGKRIENRQKWKGSSYRGPIWLHAAKGYGSKADFNATILAMRRAHTQAQHSAMFPQGWPKEFQRFIDAGQLVKSGGEILPGPKIARGAVVGRATIVGTTAGEPDPNGGVYIDVVGPPAERRLMTPGERAWWMGGFALLLDDVKILPTPVEVPGALGIFRLPERVVAECEAQLPRQPTGGGG